MPKSDRQGAKRIWRRADSSVLPALSRQVCHDCQTHLAGNLGSRLPFSNLGTTARDNSSALGLMTAITRPLLLFAVARSLLPAGRLARGLPLLIPGSSNTSARWSSFRAQ